MIETLEVFLKKVLLSLLFVIGVGVSVLSLWGLYQVHKASSWFQIEGTVEKVYFVMGGGNPSTSARLVEYTYTVLGQRYSNDREYFGINIACNKCQSLYKVGQKITVYYDENSPEDSVLKPSNNRASWLGIITGSVFILFSFFAFWFDRKNWPNKGN